MHIFCLEDTPLFATSARAALFPGVWCLDTAVIQRLLLAAFFTFSFLFFWGGGGGEGFGVVQGFCLTLKLKLIFFVSCTFVEYMIL